MRTIGFFLSLTALLLVSACRAPQSDGSPSAAAAGGSATAALMRIELPDDPVVGPAQVEVFLLDGDTGVEGADVEVVGDMTHAGMEPVIADAGTVEPGLYRTEDFRFTMAGDWILTVTATLPDGTTVREEAFATVSSP